MYHIPTKQFVPLAKLKSTAPTNIYRVDLHPRLSRDGRRVSIDATHEGLGRQMYLLDIGPILDNPPGGAPVRSVPVTAYKETPHGVTTNETDRAQSAKKFGVYEVTLHGDGAVDNPFDTVATVVFTPPSEQANAKTVYAFYDGGNTWRARVYVSESGTWKWVSACKTDKGLDGRSGTFTAEDSHLRGRLLTHPRNPRQWMTEDGRWFLNLNDTAYFLLCTHDAGGKPIPFEDFTAYVRDAVAQGITSLRSFAVCGPKGFQADDTGMWANDVFADAGFTRFRLDRFQGIDRRLQWLLDNYPEVYVQLILFPRGSRWKVDETFWKSLSDTQKERLLRWMLARYAAYPQIFWLVVNDAHYGPEYPNNNAFAREVGAYFRRTTRGSTRSRRATPGRFRFISAQRTGRLTCILRTATIWGPPPTSAITSSPSRSFSARTAMSRIISIWTRRTCGISSGGSSGPGCSRAARPTTADAGGSCNRTHRPANAPRSHPGRTPPVSPPP